MGKTHEWCPHCESEVRIDADKPSKCPNCGEMILPCSICDEIKSCDWTQEHGCWRFPSVLECGDMDYCTAKCHHHCC